MEISVQALYDFDGEEVNGELSFKTGEILFVTNKDVGEGWWLGRKQDGSTGLFPEAYVQVNEAGNTPSQNTFDQNGFGNTDDMFPGLSPPPEPTTEAPEYIPSASTPVDNFEDMSSDPWPDDEWDAPPPSAPQQSPPSISPTKQTAEVGGSSWSPVKRTDRKTTVKVGVTKNIFATFTKTAAESYVLGQSKSDFEDEQKSTILIGPDGPMWGNSAQVFSCTISDPVKESKFSGLKSFIAYNITPSHTQRSVLRRYKHFDWLYEQLARKYGVSISIPPLPDKQLTGRYDEDFIEERRAQLEGWICRIALHPVISRSEVLQHFVTSKDDEKAWKAGKRKAEKDLAVGGAFLNTVETPAEALDLVVAEQTLDTHVKFTRSMDEACKQLIAIGHDEVRRCSGICRKEYDKLGQTFKALSESFELDERPVSTPLTQALKHTGDCYQAIGELHNDQPKYDWLPLLAGLIEYKTALSTFPGVLGNEKSAMDKNKEVRKLQLESKVTTEEMEDVAARTEKLAYAVQAEVNHFQHYRVGDFAGYTKTFLEQQIAFHKEIVKKLEDTAQKYQELVPQ